MNTEATPGDIGSTEGLGDGPEACKWMQDDHCSDTWNTDCAERFCLNEGTPGDNMMRFCCYCGKPLETVEWSYPAGEDPEAEWPNDVAAAFGGLVQTPQG